MTATLRISPIVSRSLGWIAAILSLSISGVQGIPGSASLLKTYVLSCSCTEYRTASAEPAAP